MDFDGQSKHESRRAVRMRQSISDYDPKLQACHSERRSPR